MSRLMKAAVLAGIALGAVACTGGSAYVGVYGPPVYGPGPWGPYGGPYGPRGPYYGPGGVWVGVPVCCEEEQQEEEQQEEEQPEAEQPEAEQPEAEQPEEEQPEEEQMLGVEREPDQGGSLDASGGTVHPSTPLWQR